MKRAIFRLLVVVAVVGLLASGGAVADTATSPDAGSTAQEIDLVTQDHDHIIPGCGDERGGCVGSVSPLLDALSV